MKNLRGTNGGGDHDPEMLSEIYQAIKEDEIVMPAEQKGLGNLKSTFWKIHPQQKLYILGETDYLKEVFTSVA